MTETAVANATIIREGYERFARRDVEGVLALFAPDISWTIPGPEELAGHYEGHAGVLEFFGKIMAVYPDQVLEVIETVSEGDTVIVLGRDHGTAAGGAFDVGFAHLWRMQDGLARSFYEYTDTEALGRALRP
jgi:ketosteroid isomerase-like protein